MKKTFCFFLPRIDPWTSSLSPLCNPHCSNLSFCLLLLNSLCLSNYLFSNFCFVPRQLYCPNLILVGAYSLTSYAQSGSSVCFKSNSQFGDHTIIDHVCSLKFTVSNSFNRSCFVKWALAFNFKLIKNETDRNAQAV